MRKTTVAIITNVIPAYRQGFYDRLFNNEDLKVHIYCQNHVPGLNYKTIHNNYKENLTEVKFIGLNKEKLVWQFLPFLKICGEYDVIFIDGNPRIISQAILATVLRVLNKKIILWSMVHSHRNNKIFEKIRISWMSLFKYHFVYNDNDVKTLINEYGFTNKVIHGMNNGLDQVEIDKISSQMTIEKLENWKAKNGLIEKIMIISSGRLENKKYIPFLYTLKKIVQKNPNLNWIIIGDGPDLIEMVKIMNELKLKDNIIFLGEVYDNYKLAPWFLSARYFVHPSAIGLSLLHAFGFGLPVITHNNAKEHGPEFSAFVEGVTGFTYTKNNEIELEILMQKLLNDNSKLKEIKENVLKLVRSYYNVDVMYNNFLNIIHEVKNK